MKIIPHHQLLNKKEFRLLKGLIKINNLQRMPMVGEIPCNNLN